MARNRDFSRNYMRKVVYRHTMVYSSRVVTSIQNMMKKCEITTSFLASINIDPPFVRCEDYQIYKLVKYFVSVHDNLFPSPFRYIGGQLTGEKRLCQFEFDFDVRSKYILYYLYDLDDPNDPFVHLRSYSQQVDFTSWDPFNQGTHFADFPKKIINFSIFEINTTGPTWLDNVALFGNRSLLSIQQFSVISPTVDEKGSLVAISGVSLLTKDVSDLIKNIHVGFDNVKYVLLTKNEAVIIENSIGAVYPMNISLNVPTFPTLDNLSSSFWREVHHELHLHEFGELFEIKFDEMKYVVLHQPILSQNTTITYTFLVCFPLDEAIMSVFHPNARVFVMGVTVLLVSCFFSFCLFKWNEDKKDRRLSKSSPISNKMYKTELALDDLGVIPRSIQKIREIQLLYPEDIILNRVLDTTTENLSTNKNKQFSLKKFICPFCKNLVPEKVSFIDDIKEEPYTIWRQITNYEFDLQKWDEFPIDQFKERPDLMLIKYFVSLIIEGKLIFPPFDPDNVLKYLVKIGNGIKNPLHASHMLFAVHYLLSGPFKYWLNNKIDVLIVYFCAFFSQFDYRKMVDFPDIGGNENEETNKRTVAKTALDDENSTTEENFIYLFEMFDRIISSARKEENSRYFWKCVQKIMLANMYSKQFDLLGEARTRIQSPAFSVHSDFEDRLLFMEIVLKLCDFCNYWSTTDVMIHSINLANDIQFSQEEKSDKYFLASYHFEVATKIVSPWISLFTNFKSLSAVVGNISKNIEYWRNNMDKYV